MEIKVSYIRQMTRRDAMRCDVKMSERGMDFVAAPGEDVLCREGDNCPISWSGV